MDRLTLPINFDRTPDENIFTACLNAYVQQVVLRLENDVAATPEEQQERVRAFEFAAKGVANHGQDVAKQQADIRVKAKAKAARVEEEENEDDEEEDEQEEDEQEDEQQEEEEEEEEAIHKKKRYCGQHQQQLTPRV